MKAVVAVLVSLLGAQIAAAKVYDKDTKIAGMTLYYKLVLPKDFDADKTYPAVLAFPPGDQSMAMVMGTLVQNWSIEAQRRGYIVVIPAAPGGRTFTREGSRVFPEFLEQLLSEYKIRDQKFYIAGMSNGGLSAFHIAASYPQYFWSVTGFPGYLQDPTPERVSALAKMCLYMHAGELDTGWVTRMQDQTAEFRAKGITVRMTVERGQSHVIGTLMGEGAAHLFKEIEEAPQGCGR